MRQTTEIKPCYGAVKRLMIYQDDKDNNGCYLFTYDALIDGPALGDSWFVDAEEAKRACQEQYEGIDWNWRDIPDPQPGCQHDIIAPTKLVQAENGGLSFRAA